MEQGGRLVVASNHHRLFSDVVPKTPSLQHPHRHVQACALDVRLRPFRSFIPGPRNGTKNSPDAL